MSIAQEIYKSHRMVMVRFKRACTGNPQIDKPDIDDRGATGTTDHGPVVGICEGDTITVRLSRELIANNAQLFITSTDNTVVKVVSPPLGKLPNTVDMDIQLKGLSGGNPKTAKLQVRYESNVGRIIHELIVWVYTPVDVDITPHMVTITGTGTIANLNEIMTLLKAIWRPCGVKFSVGATKNDPLAFATAGVVSDAPWYSTADPRGASLTELNTLLSTTSVANTINAYFVNQIGTVGTLGYGISRASAITHKFTKPGVVLADRTAGSAREDVMHWANDLAHEIGHFFGLWHPESLQPPNVRKDTWSRRMLMHNFNLMHGKGVYPAPPLLEGADYGDRRRGCFITMKNFAQLTTDGECATSRATINSAAGPY
jgi:hypothetical protein